MENTTPTNAVSSFPRSAISVFKAIGHMTIYGEHGGHLKSGKPVYSGN
jgi:hypothetical protein